MSPLAPLYALTAFWTRPIRAESLALFRILLGLTLLASQLTGIARTLAETCGPEGTCPAEIVDPYLRTGRFCLLSGPASLPLLSDWLPEDLASRAPWLNDLLPPGAARAWADWGRQPSAAYLLFGLFLASVVFMTLGLLTRPATLVALVLACTFHNRLAWLMNGGDALARNALYLLLLSPAGACWSLDRRVWGWLRGRADAGPVLIAPWSVRLMQVHVCLMYLFTGMVKLGDSLDPSLIGSEGWGAFFAHWARNDWLDGQALYWVLNDVSITRWSYAQLPVPMLACRLLSWGTIAFELGFSFGVLVRPLRWVVLVAGVLFHLGILATMEIGWFSQIAICWYLVFVPGQAVSAFLARLTRRAAAPPPTPAAAAAGV